MQRNTAYGMEAVDEDVIAEINVTPFIDIMLVMLIIFMITAPMMLGGVAINLPKAATGPMPRPQKPAIVSVDAQRTLFFGNEPILVPDRIAFLKQAALASETGEVFLKGDGSVPYAVMMAVMAELGSAGFSRVILVTDARPQPLEAAGALMQTGGILPLDHENARQNSLPGPLMPEAQPTDPGARGAPAMREGL